MGGGWVGGWQDVALSLSLSHSLDRIYLARNLGQESKGLGGLRQRDEILLLEEFGLEEEVLSESVGGGVRRGWAWVGEGGAGCSHLRSRAGRRT